jgi:hypothetical protein
MVKTMSKKTKKSRNFNEMRAKTSPERRAINWIGLREAAAHEIALNALKACNEHTEPEELAKMAYQKMGELIKKIVR